MATTDLNHSNNILTSGEIEGLLALYEGEGIPDFFLTNVADTANMAESDKDYIRRNFPRGNPFRMVIQKLAWSVPMPSFKLVRPEPVEPDGEEMEHPAQAKLDALLRRPVWEGAKDLWAALVSWRCFLFVTGDVFIKLSRDKKGQALPDRMPAQDTKLLLSQTRRKTIEGYRFTFDVGGSMYEDDPTGTKQIVETIELGKWTQEGDNGTVEIKTQSDFIPVAHLAWEEREDSPRGLPLGMRLADKLLHVYSAALDRRLGNKMGSVPMYALINAVPDSEPTPRPGLIIGLKTEVPGMPADFKGISTSHSDANLRAEYVDAMRELHSEAFLPFELDMNGGGVDKHSGKAIQMLSSDQVKYRENYQLVESAFLKELVLMSLRLEGVKLDDNDLEVQYDPVVSADPNERRADAQFYLDAGAAVEAFEIMGKEEAEAKRLAQQVEEGKTARLLTANPFMGETGMQALKGQQGDMSGLKPEPDEESDDDKSDEDDTVRV